MQENIPAWTQDPKSRRELSINRPRAVVPIKEHEIEAVWCKTHVGQRVADHEFRSDIVAAAVLDVHRGERPNAVRFLSSREKHRRCTDMGSDFENRPRAQMTNQIVDRPPVTRTNTALDLSESWEGQKIRGVGRMMKDCLYIEGRAQPGQLKRLPRRGAQANLVLRPTRQAGKGGRRE